MMMHCYMKRMTKEAKSMLLKRKEVHKGKFSFNLFTYNSHLHLKIHNLQFKIHMKNYSSCYFVCFLYT